MARRHGFAPWRRRFQGETSEGTLGTERVILLADDLHERFRPCRAGRRKLLQDRPGDVTVFHDELELPPGKVRVKIGGGIAGHNGLRSISAHIGNDYRRVRPRHPVIPASRSWCMAACCRTLPRPTMTEEWRRCARRWPSTQAQWPGHGRDFRRQVHLAMQAKGF
ncbi:aminoacyl-tRNA hydrolase [Bradyrhizobium betae]